MPVWTVRKIVVSQAAQSDRRGSRSADARVVGPQREQPIPGAPGHAVVLEQIGQVPGAIAIGGAEDAAGRCRRRSVSSPGNTCACMSTTSMSYVLTSAPQIGGYIHEGFAQARVGPVFADEERQHRAIRRWRRAGRRETPAARACPMARGRGRQCAVRPARRARRPRRRERALHARQARGAPANQAQRRRQHHPRQGQREVPHAHFARRVHAVQRQRHQQRTGQQQVGARPVFVDASRTTMPTSRSASTTSPSMSAMSTK